MEWLLLVGYVLFGGLFVIGGIGHFTSLAGMTGYARMKGVPLPETAVMVSGLVSILAGLGVIFGIYRGLSLLLIAAFVLVVTPVMHNFWKATDPNMRMTDRIMFLKNAALLGAALALYALSSASGAPLSGLY